MTNEEILERIKGHLIVSCQALPHEPLYVEEYTVMHLMAKAAYLAGAKGIRANSVRDIKKIKETVDLPVIGIIKIDYEDSDIYITPTLDEVDQLVEAGADIIAFDLTDRIRPNGKTRDEFFKECKEKYPNQLFMADISTLEEGLHAFELGVDFVGPTLSGYTPYSTQQPGPDFELIKGLVDKGVRVIAEGKIHTPEMLKQVKELGAYTYVVGGAITRPLEIATRFVKAIEE